MSFFVTESEGAYYPTTAGMIALVVLMLAVLAVGAYLTNRGKEKKTPTKQLVYMAVAMALAFVTSNLKLFSAPMGGSVTLFSMFFLTLIGYWYGLSAGLMTGVAYGLLQMMVDPYIISVPQMLCDYILAFGALGLSGLFSKRKNGIIPGYLVGIFGRFVFSFLSGLIFFGMYAPEGMNPAVYSFLYNGSYIAAEGILTLIVLAIPAVRNALAQIKRSAAA